MRFFAFIFLFSFCLSSSLKAQQRVGNVNLDTIHIVLELRNTNEGNQDEINSILRSAAYTHQKPAENIKVSWALVPSFHIQRQEDGSFKSEISINSLAPIGDTKLYSFESTEYIFPAIKSFRVQVYKADGSLVYVKEYNQKIISAKSEPRMFSFPFEHQRWTNGWSIEIDQLKLEYNTEEYSFEKWFQYTNDYQAANYLVDSLLEGYRYLQRSSHEPKSFLVKSIRQAKSMKHLCELPFYQATVLSKKDPDNLEKKVKIFQTFLDLNIQKYSDLVESSSFLDNEMVEELVETYLNEDEDLLNWQQKYLGIYDDLFAQLSKTNYPENLQYKNKSLFEIIQEKPAEREALIEAFEREIYGKSYTRLSNLIESQRFIEALYMIGNLERFAPQSKVVILTDELKRQKAVTTYGLYYSYVKVADKAILAKNASLALQYIKKAGSVQQMYPQEIITNNLAERKLRKLLDGWFVDYDLMIQQSRFKEAYEKRDTIKELIVKYNFKEVQAILDSFDYRSLNTTL